MKSKTLYAAMAGLLMLSACTTTRTVEVPKEIKVPVSVECPEADIRSAGDRPRLPIEDIDETTTLDQDLNLWRATVLVLQGYVGLLETEVQDARSAYETCRSAGK